MTEEEYRKVSKLMKAMPSFAPRITELLDTILSVGLNYAVTGQTQSEEYPVCVIHWDSGKYIVAIAGLDMKGPVLAFTRDFSSFGLRTPFGFVEEIPPTEDQKTICSALMTWEQNQGSSAQMMIDFSRAFTEKVRYGSKMDVLDEFVEFTYQAFERHHEYDGMNRKEIHDEIVKNYSINPLVLTDENVIETLKKYGANMSNIHIVA